jgi:hypothetical protein
MEVEIKQFFTEYSNFSSIINRNDYGKSHKLNTSFILFLSNTLANT